MSPGDIGGANYRQNYRDLPAWESVLSTLRGWPVAQAVEVVNEIVLTTTQNRVDVGFSVLEAVKTGDVAVPRVVSHDEAALHLSPQAKWSDSAQCGGSSK